MNRHEPHSQSQDLLDPDSAASNPITVEVMSLRPCVRNDLRITKQVHSGQASFLNEDPLSGRFSRIGVTEYTFISSLDGRTTVAEALALTASKHGVNALDESDAISLCGWLVESGIAHTKSSRSSGRVSDSVRKMNSQKLAGAMNPMFQKLPLFNPSFLVNPFVRLLRSAFRYPGVSVTVQGGLCVWMILTLIALLSHGGRFLESTQDVFAAANWIWLGMAWLMVKGVHEFGHAVACRWLGGRVGEAGLMMVLFMPMPYVDVSTSWALQNKWHRILVASAGMLVEVMLASLAFWVWASTENSLIQMHARNMIVTATLTTVLFNLNPLMRFDGYYMLSDSLELPNLATNGTRWLTYMRQKYWFGLAVSRPTWPEGKVPLVAIYAVAAFGWRILICVSLATAAMHLFWGAGVLLAMSAIVVWIGKPMLRFISNWNDPMRINKRRFLTLSGGMAALSLIAMMIPYQRNVTAPMVVAYQGPMEIRTNVRGFVDQVLVAPGQSVRPGQVLARLRDRELELDQTRLRIEVEQSKQRQRVYRNQQSLVELEIEQASELALEARRRELDDRSGHLTVVAGVEGQVIVSDLIDAEGTLVTAGQRLFVIANPKKMKFVAMIGQDDAVTLRKRDIFTASAWINGLGKLNKPAVFDWLDPRATHDLAYPAFASSLGGPLAVYANPQAKQEREKWRLVDARVVAEAHWNVAIEETEHSTDSACSIQPLRSGQIGLVRFSLERRPAGEVLLDELQQWYQDINRNTRVASR